MTIRHHPDDATLMSFAAGALRPAHCVIVAAHARLCARCRQELALLDLVGGALMDALPPARVGQPPTPMYAADMKAPEPAALFSAPGLPQPLARLTGHTLDTVPWRRVTRGIWLHDIALATPAAGSLRLLKAAGGHSIPEHSHGGGEMTLVLEGAFRDEIGEFGVGDVADLDAEASHTPVADGTAGCICVIASDTAPRFSNLLIRIVRPFLRI